MRLVCPCFRLRRVTERLRHVPSWSRHPAHGRSTRSELPRVDCHPCELTAEASTVAVAAGRVDPRVMSSDN